MTDREAMQMALDALEAENLQQGSEFACNKAIEALRTALEKPEQYDQTELELCKKCGWKAVWPDGCLICEKQEALMQSKLEPVKLQDDEIYDAAFSAYCKGENSRELFRIMWGNRLTCSIGWDREELKSFARNIAALYTAQLQPQAPVIDKTMAKRIATQLGWVPKKEWVGLTDEDIKTMWDNHIIPVFNKNGISPFVFARAIESKLKEKNNG